MQSTPQTSSIRSRVLTNSDLMTPSDSPGTTVTALATIRTGAGGEWPHVEVLGRRFEDDRLQGDMAVGMGLHIHLRNFPGPWL